MQNARKATGSIACVHSQIQNRTMKAVVATSRRRQDAETRFSKTIGNYVVREMVCRNSLLNTLVCKRCKYMFLQEPFEEARMRSYERAAL